MTDINQWPELIQKVQLRKLDTVGNDWFEKNPHFIDYIVVPLTEYHIGNLLGALKQVKDIGDWYSEFIDMCVIAMEKAAIKEVRSNNGDTFKLENLKQRKL